MKKTAAAIAAVALLTVGSSTATASDPSPPPPCTVPSGPPGGTPANPVECVIDVIVGVPAPIPTSASPLDPACRTRPVEVPDPRPC